MNLAATFKEHATTRGVTQQELAEVTGVSRQSIYRKINGLTPMTVGEAYMIAEYLGLNLARLLREVPDDA